ncbi:MAG: TRAP transporter small permease [Hyphomicrobiales bacterium]|nr:TRAP transporter small permease [Hyphomicrobiales bacterium]
MSDAAIAPEPKFRFVRKIIEWWALLGGVLLLGVVLVTAWSLFRDILWAKPVTGENEIVQVGIAVAVFSFLPYCQMTGANISADIFTARTGARVIALLTLLGSLVALVFACILVWRTWAGLLDYREYLETTPIMQFPIWMAFVPILISIVLLVLASALSVHEAIDDFRNRRERAPMMH